MHTPSVPSRKGKILFAMHGRPEEEQTRALQLVHAYQRMNSVHGKTMSLSRADLFNFLETVKDAARVFILARLQ